MEWSVCLQMTLSKDNKKAYYYLSLPRLTFAGKHRSDCWMGGALEKPGMVCKQKR